MAAAAEELGLEIAAVGVPVSVDGPVRKAATGGAVLSAEKELVVLLAARAAMAWAHTVTVVLVSQKKTVAPLVASAARTQTACLGEDHGAAVEVMRPRWGLVIAEAEAVGARAAAGVPAAVARERADCPAVEVLGAASAPPALSSWLLPHLSL